MHLVGFTIGIYHDAQSHKYQIRNNTRSKRISTTWRVWCTRIGKPSVRFPLRDTNSNQPRPWRWVHFVTQPVKKFSNRTTVLIIVFTKVRYCGLSSATFIIISRCVILSISKIFRQTSGVPSSPKKILINIFPQTLIFQGTARYGQPQTFRLFLWWHQIEFNLKDTSSTHFYVSHTIRSCPETFDMLRQSTSRRVQCMNWFRQSKFWAFVVNCELINSKKSTVIRFRTCVVNVVYQL